MGAVVPHHPQPSLGHLHRTELITEAGIDVGVGHHRRRIQIRLVELLAVDRQPGCRAALHGLTAHRDDPLDQVVLIWRHETDEGQRVLCESDHRVVRTDRLVADVPVGRALEDDHVTRLGLGEVVGQLVDHDPVAHAAGAAVQGGFHRFRRDQVRPRHEGEHHVVHDQRDGDEDDPFTHRTRFAFGLVGFLVLDGVGDGIFDIRIRPVGGRRTFFVLGHGIRVISIADRSGRRAGTSVSASP
jgi:hypothetical protein